MKNQNPQPSENSKIEYPTTPNQVKEKKKRRNLKKERVRKALDWFAKHT